MRSLDVPNQQSTYLCRTPLSHHRDNTMIISASPRTVVSIVAVRCDGFTYTFDFWVVSFKLIAILAVVYGGSIFWFLAEMVRIGLQGRVGIYPVDTTNYITLQFGTYIFYEIYSYALVCVEMHLFCFVLLRYTCSFSVFFSVFC